MMANVCSPQWWETVNFVFQFVCILALLSFDFALAKAKCNEIMTSWMRNALYIAGAGWISISLFQVIGLVVAYKSRQRSAKVYPWNEDNRITAENTGWMISSIVLTITAFQIPCNNVTAEAGGLTDLNVWIPLAIGFQGSAFAAACKVIQRLFEFPNHE